MKQVSFITALLRKHWVVSLIATAYVVLELSVITWGIPSANQVFLYHMDEWHQLMAVKAVKENFTTTLDGAAHGTMFHFLLSGAWLLAFSLLGVLHPEAVLHPATALLEQEKIFIVLRLSTLLFGVGTIICIYQILKKYFKVSPVVGLILFVFSPNFLSFSNYFKYDIALLFWIVLTVFYLFKYVSTHEKKWFLITNFVAAIAVATKISALPLLPIIWITFYLYQPNKWRSLLLLLNGTAIFVFSCLVLAFPDLLFGFGDYSIVLKDVIQHTPSTSQEYQLGMHYWWYLVTNQVFVNFGRVLGVLFIVAVFFLGLKLWKRERLIKKYPYLSISIVSFIWFLLSIVPLRFFATGNRALVLLPFMVLIVVGLLQPLLQYRNKIILALLSVAMFLQIIEGISWVATKWVPDPRQVSSSWVEQNIPKGTNIGLVPSPIYEMPPDILLKDYFSAQFDSSYQSMYSYQLISPNDEALPPVVIITGVHLDSIRAGAPKRALQERLYQEGYTEAAAFYPDRRLQQYFGDEIAFLAPNLVPTPRYIKIYTKPATQ